MQIKIIQQSDQTISAYNRSFQFGDGHFTTLKVFNHKIEHWSLHLSRLINANQKLDFTPFSPKQIILLEQTLMQLAQTKPNCIIKVLVSRGDSQRGYAYPDDIEPKISCFISDYNADFFTYPNGIALSKVKVQLGYQPLLAGLKHCNRLEQVLIKQDLAKHNSADGIVCGLNGELIETSVANIFVLINGRWCTPCLRQTGIAGVKRAWVLSQFELMNQDCQIKQIEANDIMQISAGFICNALMGLVPIQSIEDRNLSIDLSKDIIKQLVHQTDDTSNTSSNTSSGASSRSSTNQPSSI